jgi:hypothetical protein
LDSDTQGLLNGAFFVFKLKDNFFVEPSDFAEFANHIFDGFGDINIVLEFVCVVLIVFDEIGVHILHYITHLANDVNLGDVLLQRASVSQGLKLLLTELFARFGESVMGNM